MREPWLLEHTASDGPAHAVVYTIPSAGSGAASHRDLAQGFPLSLSLLTVRLPGRESRFSEPLLRDMPSVVAECTENIGRHALGHGKPFILLGDCSGAFVAYEVARRLEQERLALGGLAVLGQVAPSAWDTSSPMVGLPSDQFLKALLEAGIVSAEVAADPYKFAFFEPVLRADLNVVESYEWKPTDLPRFPILVFAGQPRESGEQEDMRAWTGATHGMVQLVLFSKAASSWAGIVCAALEKLLRIA